MAALAPGEVTRPLQSSSNYISDTRSHEQTPDTSCLFLDWKSLISLTQVVRLQLAEHQWRQQPHSHPQRGSAYNLHGTFHHPFPLSWSKKLRAVCILQQRGPQESLLAPLHRVRAAPMLCCSTLCPMVLTSLVCCLPSASAPMFGTTGPEISRKEYSILGIACVSF